jgi:hypothetical protein
MRPSAFGECHIRGIDQSTPCQERLQDEGHTQWVVMVQVDDCAPGEECDCKLLHPLYAIDEDLPNIACPDCHTQLYAELWDIEDDELLAQFDRMNEPARSHALIDFWQRRRNQYVNGFMSLERWLQFNRRLSGEDLMASGWWMVSSQESQHDTGSGICCHCQRIVSAKLILREGE